jgi:hypothetical protein
MPSALNGLVESIWAALGLFLALTAVIIASRAAGRLRQSRLWRRRSLYQQVDERLLSGEPVPAADLRLRRPGDAVVLEGMLLPLLVFLRGPLQAAVTRAAEDAGLVDLRLRDLSRRGAHARAEAMEKLGRLRSTKAVAPLVESLSRESPAIRHVAVRALGRIAAPEALEPLLDELERADEAGLKVVTQAVVGYGWGCVPALLRRLERPGAHAEREVSILGRLRAQEAVPRLIELLDAAPTPHLRAAAAAALGATAHPDGLPALLRALSDPMREVRAQAAWALGRVGDPRAVEPLDAALGDGYLWVRLRAAESLAALGEGGLAALRRRAAGPGSEVRTLAREILDVAGEPR